MFESILNPIFGPLLNLPVFWAVFIVSFVIALLITLVYKWMTNQHLMKSLKDEIKAFQQQMKEFKHDPKKVMDIQKRAMQTNMKYMMHSMKPTLITFLPIIIIFGWLHANLAFVPIMPGQEFIVGAEFQPDISGDVNLIVPENIELLNNASQEIKDGKAAWKLKGGAGEYILEYQYGDRIYSKELLITSEQGYKEPIKKINDDIVKVLETNHAKTTPLEIFGWKIGWLGTYIIFSIIFSMGLRKILKLH
jgi:uncharacterized membrane protein (DUF106 family)